MIDSDAFDPQQWVYGARGIPGTASEQNVAVNLDSQGWRLLKVSVFAGAAGGSFRSPFTFGDLINIAANGSLCLEPSGYAKPYTDLNFTADGGLLVVEYLYKAIEDGTEPTIVIT